MSLELSDLQTHGEVLAEELEDPAFRVEWERLTLARAVGECVLRYRTSRKLSQRRLAEILGIRQPQVARIEGGAHDPSLGALRLLSDRLGLEFLIDIGPSRAGGRWITAKPSHAELFEDTELSTGTRLTVAARHRA
ncbi:MAG: helix-turn-helix transcriptional regulator [Chloroflexi bacterium]|nr:helix-turn-helix transcriptional regulator [Chloroflexota bacterium]